MSDIFISYASSDRAAAETCARAFRNQGWSVFWDRTIPIGKTWDEIIESELSAARAMVVLWSGKSVESEWVRAEAGEAADRGILFPAQIQKNIEIPLRFRSMQAADLSEWDGNPESPAFQILVGAIEAMLGTAPGGKEESDIGTVQKKKEKSEPPHKTEGKKESGKFVTLWNSLSAKSKITLAASCVAIFVVLVAVALLRGEMKVEANFDDNPKEWILQGSAVREGRRVVLDKNSTGAGSIFYRFPVPNCEEFEVSFDFLINGIDGFTFAWIPDLPKDNELKSYTGSHLGYGSLGGYAIEFDLFRDDVEQINKGPHVALITHPHSPPLAYKHVQLIRREVTNCEITLRESTVTVKLNPSDKKNPVITQKITPYKPFNAYLGFTIASREVKIFNVKMTAAFRQE